MEGIARKKDGSTFPTETSTSYWKKGDEIVFGGIVRDITQRKQMEKKLRTSHNCLEKAVIQRTQELREANKKLTIAQQNLNKFTGRLLSLKEEERKELSTTLHDELGSMTLSVASKISIAKEDIKNNNRADALKTLEKGQAVVQKAVAGLRKVAVNLRPPNLEIMGLEAALIDLLDNVKKQSPLQINFINNLDSKRIPEDIAIVIYRVIQEALTNIAKHSKASAVSVRLYSDKNKVNLSIADDGVGFDIVKFYKRSKRANIGIEGMRERVESMGGEFIISSAPNHGTQVKVTLPKK